MIVIAGTQVEVDQDDQALADAISTLDPSVIMQFDVNAINHSLNALPIKYPPPLAPIRFGVLNWPSDASRFATFHCLVDDATKEILDPLLFGSTGPIEVSVTIDDGTGGSITANMLALPFRSVSQIVGTLTLAAGGTEAYEANGLNILTMVDDRYFWWQQSANFVVNVGTTTWATLFTDVATALGITLTADSVPSAYGMPSCRFTAYQQPIPLYFDALAYTVGMRVCVALNGSVSVQQATTAQTSNNSSLSSCSYNTSTASWQYTQNQQNLVTVHGGGVFNNSDLTQSVPASVTVWFPSTSYSAPSSQGYTLQISLASLGISAYSGVTGYTGSKVIVGDLIATSMGGSPTNISALAAYATQAATDWYNWQLGNVDLELNGIIPWTPSAWVDEIIWFFRGGNASGPSTQPGMSSIMGLAGSMLATRILRKTWNDRELGNIGTCSPCIQSFHNNFPQINNFQNDTAQLAGKDNNNCAVWFNIAECMAGSGSLSGGGGTYQDLGPPPNAPTGLTIANTATTLILSWTPPSGQPQAASYDVWYALTNTGTTIWTKWINTTNTTTTITGLTTGTLVYVMVDALNWLGNSGLAVSGSGTPSAMPTPRGSPGITNGNNLSTINYPPSYVASSDQFWAMVASATPISTPSGWTPIASVNFTSNTFLYAFTRPATGVSGGTFSVTPANDDQQWYVYAIENYHSYDNDGSVNSGTGTGGTTTMSISSIAAAQANELMLIIFGTWAIGGGVYTMPVGVTPTATETSQVNDNCTSCCGYETIAGTSTGVLTAGLTWSSGTPQKCGLAVLMK